MTQILRYDTSEIVLTPLNPIEDLISWITGLRSTGYTSDILKIKHGFTNKAEIKQGSQLIALFSSNARGLLEQAYAGPEEMSFLPLYYAILNLSKIYIVASGMTGFLDTNRYHGASYDPTKKNSRDLLTESITLKQNGVLPLFYKAITSENWGFGNSKIKTNDLYPYIYGITHEFQHAYKTTLALRGLSLEIDGDVNLGFRVKATLANSDHPYANNKRYLKVLKGIYRFDAQSNAYFSNTVKGTSIETTSPILFQAIRRQLIFSTIGRNDRIITFTPISPKQLILSEEIPIWLAFFHLSNVVRYNPEFIEKLANSKAWPMLLSLRKHTMLRFLSLFWSFLHQTEYQILVR